MSEPLVRWVEALPDGSVREEIVLQGNGTLERAVAAPAYAPAPTMGWFGGVVDDGTLALARSVSSRAVDDEPVGPRPQAGGWTAHTSAATIALWGEAGGSTADTLRSLLAAAVDNASEPATALRFEARWAVVGDERAPLLSLMNVGSTPLWCTIDAPDGATATFLDEDGSALGFLGSTITLDGGARGGGLLRRWTGDDHLTLSVRLVRPDDAALVGQVVATIADEG